MDEPVILTGGAELTTIGIVLPLSFKTEDVKGGRFSVPLKPGTEPTGIVITDTDTGEQTLIHIKPKNWTIEIK